MARPRCLLVVRLHPIANDLPIRTHSRFHHIRDYHISDCLCVACDLGMGIPLSQMDRGLSSTFTNSDRISTSGVFLCLVPSGLHGCLGVSVGPSPANLQCAGELVCLSHLPGHFRLVPPDCHLILSRVHPARPLCFVNTIRKSRTMRGGNDAGASAVPISPQ